VTGEGDTTSDSTLVPDGVNRITLIDPESATACESVQGKPTRVQSDPSAWNIRIGPGSLGADPSELLGSAIC
jgi:hypothetical protein